jgi:hypothetical protein
MLTTKSESRVLDKSIQMKYRIFSQQTQGGSLMTQGQTNNLTAEQETALAELREIMKRASGPFDGVDWGRVWYTLIPPLAGGLKPQEITELSLERWKEVFGVHSFEVALALQATVIELAMRHSGSGDPTANYTRELMERIRKISHVHRLVRYLDPN